jgi:hypothetical protein
MIFLLGFLIKKHPKVTSVKITTLSIWTNHFGHVMHDWAIKLDLVILTCKMIDKMIDKMTDYSTNR